MKSENQTSGNKYQPDYFKLVHYRYITFITLPGAPVHCANCTSDSYGTSAEGRSVSIDSLRVGRSFLKKEKAVGRSSTDEFLEIVGLKKTFYGYFALNFSKLTLPFHATSHFHSNIAWFRTSFCMKKFKQIALKIEKFGGLRAKPTLFRKI